MTGLFAGFGAQAAAYSAPHVLLWHGGISGAKIPSGHVLTGQDIEISTDQIRLAGGGNDFLGCFYPGPIYPVKVDEQECGFWVHELDERDFVAAIGHIHQKQQIGGDFGDDVRSRWIETPITKTVRSSQDLTSDDVQSRTIDAEGKNVRLEFTVYQDEADKIDRAALEAFYKDQGAASVDIQIIHIPRVQVRSESVLAAATLADKLVESARLREETVATEVLEMAAVLENTPAERVIEMVMGGEI